MVAASPKGRPTPETKRCDVELSVVCLSNLKWNPEEDQISISVKWKGPKSALGSRFRKSQAKHTTPARVMTQEGMVLWEEDVRFKHQCILLGAKGFEEVSYQPWDVNLVIQKASASAPERTTVLGRASLNLSDFASSSRDPCTVIPVELEGKGEGTAELKVKVSLVELRNEDAPANGDILPSPKPKRPSRLSMRHARSKSLTFMEEVLKRPNTPPATMTSSMMSSDADDEAESEELLSEGGLAAVDLPLKYNSMVASNLAAAHGVMGLAEVDRAVIQPLPKSASLERTLSVPLPDVSDGEEEAASKSRGLFKKRKLSFRSPKGDPLLWTKEKEEPLLNKVKAEEEEVVGAWESPYTDSTSAEHGRWLEGKSQAGLPPSLSSESLSASDGNYSSGGEEEHKIGTWQQRQIVSRDGSSRMLGEVFFASFDQRSESAAGESACTALVAVMADWLHQHPNQMPTKAVFNRLIQEGSREWRAMCSVDEYKEQFKDRHFDLETVLGARIRPLKVDHLHSFVGFFKPPEMETPHEMLEGSMSFDEIWGELEKAGGGIYIVSWNDHFFILKVDESRCYIIDTLGERLVEGCSRAFMLRFEGGCRCKQVAETREEIRKEEAAKAAAAQAEKDKASAPKKKQKASPYAGGLARTVSGVPAVKASEKEDSPKGIGRTLSMSTLGALLGRTSSGSFGAGSKSAEKAALIAKEASAEAEGKNPDGKTLDGSVSEGKGVDGKSGEGKEIAEAGGSEEVKDEREGSATEEKIEECGLGRGMCQGRHFVKDFLAAVPLRALAEDLQAKRAVQVHQRLQIEFNYTRLLDLFNEKDVKKLG